VSWFRDLWSAVERGITWEIGVSSCCSKLTTPRLGHCCYPAGMVRPRPAVVRWWHGLQDLGYYAGEYLLIGLVGPEGPGRIVRRVFRIPIFLYRAGLGPLIGHNVLVLRTTGRRTARSHLTAMRYEHDPDSDTFYVLSGWKGRTDWYQNVRRSSRVQVRVRNRQFPAVAQLLPIDDSAAVRRRYLDRNPFAVGTIRKETSIACDGSQAGLRAVAVHYSAVALRPDVPVPVARPQPT